MKNSRTPARPNAWKRHIYRILTLAALTLLAVGTVAYQILEGWGWIDSLYFSTVALTTVGFGDLAPTSSTSKLFTVFYILSGIGLITTYLQARLAARGHRLAAISAGLTPGDGDQASRSD